MQEENNIGTKVIGGIAVAVAFWGLYKVLQMTDAPKAESKKQKAK